MPELASVPNKVIHKPWELNGDARRGVEYPDPLVDLKQTRVRALEAFSAIKGTKNA